MIQRRDLPPMFRSFCIAGNATLSAEKSMKTMLEASIVDTNVQSSLLLFAAKFIFITNNYYLELNLKKSK